MLELAEAGLAEMRALIFELLPDSFAGEGLVAALARQASLLQARHRIAVQADLCAEPELPLPAKEALYRAGQEALNNVVRHAGARSVQVALRHEPPWVTLEIRDDGRGFDPWGDYPGHLGLRSMRERAEQYGGSVAIESVPGQGARVVVRIPESA